MVEYVKAISEFFGAAKAALKLVFQRNAQNNTPAMQARAESVDDEATRVKIETDIAKGDLAAVQKDEAEAP